MNRAARPRFSAVGVEHDYLIPMIDRKTLEKRCRSVTGW
jgi:hypothetical protein